MNSLKRCSLFQPVKVLCGIVFYERQQRLCPRSPKVTMEIPKHLRANMGHWRGGEAQAASSGRHDDDGLFKTCDKIIVRHRQEESRPFWRCGEHNAKRKELVLKRFLNIRNRE